MTYEEAKATLKYHEGVIKRLEEEHGTGVRPSWVSTDIALAHHYAAQARMVVEEMEKVNET